MEVVTSLSQGRTAAVQCGLFTHKSVPVIFEPPFILRQCLGYMLVGGWRMGRERKIFLAKCFLNPFLHKTFSPSTKH